MSNEFVVLIPHYNLLPWNIPLPMTFQKYWIDTNRNADSKFDEEDIPIRKCIYADSLGIIAIRDTEKRTGEISLHFKNEESMGMYLMIHG